MLDADIDERLTTVQFIRSIFAVAVSVTNPALRDTVADIVTLVLICFTRVVQTYQQQATSKS